MKNFRDIVVKIHDFNCPRCETRANFEIQGGDRFISITCGCNEALKMIEANSIIYFNDSSSDTDNSSYK